MPIIAIEYYSGPRLSGDVNTSQSSIVDKPFFDDSIFAPLPGVVMVAALYALIQGCAIAYHIRAGLPQEWKPAALFTPLLDQTLGVIIIAFTVKPVCILIRREKAEGVIAGLFIFFVVSLISLCRRTAAHRPLAGLRNME
ncbi:hypothetical protein HYR69_10305 [Candidatus Sumerlaeota bacterium]|nr:hypothetical protein [Candidatus Sumerlaeota bacterium]